MDITTISEVKPNQLSEVLDYVINFRNELFPKLDLQALPKDLEDFRAVYMESKTGAFLQARNGEGQLIGVIGMMPYDYRFSHLHMSLHTTVEVARLFVDPNYRRTGLATRLFKKLQVIAREREIDRSYLHTHPFLAGAYEFWQKQGFGLLTFCSEKGFPTLHMEKLLNQKLNCNRKYMQPKELENETFV